MRAVENLRPTGQEVEEAWNAFRVIVRQGFADRELWGSASWLERYANAEERFRALFTRWCPPRGERR